MCHALQWYIMWQRNCSKHVSCYIVLLQLKILSANFFWKPNLFSPYMYTELLRIVRVVQSSIIAGDTSGPADTLSSTETAGTGTPITSGDVTATLESTTGGK